MGREAYERVVKQIIDHGKMQQQNGGKGISEREARKQAQESHVRVDRNQGTNRGGERR